MKLLAHAQILSSALSLFLATLTAARPASPSNLTAPGEHHPMCTNRLSWMTNSFDPNDCLDALHRLENTDYRHYRARSFEFLAPGASRTTKLDTIRTPLRYTVGTCTLVIAMLSTFEEFSLPGQVMRRRDYAPSDESRFTYLWSVAAWLDTRCVDERSFMGWCATGQAFDIGVLFLATDGEFNKGIPGGRVGLYTGNGSGVGAVDAERERESVAVRLLGGVETSL